MEKVEAEVEEMSWTSTSYNRVAEAREFVVNVAILGG